MDRPILVTGGAGFIGANFILAWLSNEKSGVVNLDKLTYAGNLQSLRSVEAEGRYHFIKGDICDSDLLEEILQDHRPRAIVNFAAESHVDRSIQFPDDFLMTNVVGTGRLLQAAHKYWIGLDSAEKSFFRFLHISTDEVFGSLDVNDPKFTEQNRYDPRSPYSASKASSDHLVRAWCHTYGLPTLIINCSNNYGPRQFPEKLIPLTILNGIQEKPIPIYGDGRQVRDWLYVEDHCSAISTVLQLGHVGETYNVGGQSEKQNVDVVIAICDLLDKKMPMSSGLKRQDCLVRFVEDRPGHDRRYAMDPGKIRRELGWTPKETFESGIEKTVAWYIENPLWIASIASGDNP